MSISLVPALLKRARLRVILSGETGETTATTIRHARAMNRDARKAGGKKWLEVLIKVAKGRNRRSQKKVNQLEKSVTASRPA